VSVSGRLKHGIGKHKLHGIQREIEREREREREVAIRRFQEKMGEEEKR
jgi:hypothetical protein